ncbi:MAG: adenylate/guanylate cyclase domain-containing protein [Nocardioides sp.]
MALSDDVEAGVKGVLDATWSRRSGQVVPETDTVALGNGAVDLTATYLYADMADSTGLVQGFRDWCAAKVIRCYLNAASKLIRARGGEIRSFDGDRVMGIFVGSSKNTSAVKAALQINWAVVNVIRPALIAEWDDFAWTMNHGIGIDTGGAMIVRGGVRGDNDLISIGHAPNIAAKLSEERGSKSTYISADVYDHIADEAKYSKGANMWSKIGTKSFGGRNVTYYGSSYWWKP